MEAAKSTFIVLQMASAAARLLGCNVGTRCDGEEEEKLFFSVQLKNGKKRISQDLAEK